MSVQKPLYVLEVPLTDEVLRAVDAQAAAQGMSAAEFVALAAAEKAEAEAEAAAALALRAGGERPAEWDQA